MAELGVARPATCPAPGRERTPRGDGIERRITRAVIAVRFEAGELQTIFGCHWEFPLLSR